MPGQPSAPSSASSSRRVVPEAPSRATARRLATQAGDQTALALWLTSSRPSARAILHACWLAMLDVLVMVSSHLLSMGLSSQAFWTLIAPCLSWGLVGLLFRCLRWGLDSGVALASFSCARSLLVPLIKREVCVCRSLCIEITGASTFWRCLTRKYGF